MSIEIDPDALLLVDVGHIFWRAWHASRESQTDAYTTTVETCLRYAEQFPHTVICCDSPTNWRHELTAHLEPKLRYKANRDPKKADALLSLIDAEERLRDIGLRVCKLDGYEADDVIATLKAQAWPRRVIIRTEDKDLAQLVDETCVLWTNKGERGAADVERVYGVLPPLMRDLLAMWGDTSDNIPGCPKIGQGFASKLLNAFGSIAGVQEATAEEDFSFPGVGPERIACIRAWDPEMAVKLTSLAFDAPVSLDAILAMNGAPMGERKTEDSEPEFF